MHDGDKTFAHTAEVVDAEILALPLHLSNESTTDDAGNVVESKFKDSDWFKELLEIAGAYGENIDDADNDLWFDHSIDKTLQEAFFNVYTEHKPAAPTINQQTGGSQFF